MNRRERLRKQREEEARDTAAEAKRGADRMLREIDELLGDST